MKRIGNRGEVRQLDAALIGKLPSSGSPFEGRSAKKIGDQKPQEATPFYSFQQTKEIKWSKTEVLDKFPKQLN